jgi:sodium transport system permease protein
MRFAGAVFRKEMLDSLRDRRSLLSALLFPLFGPVLVALMFTFIARTQGAEKPLELPVVGRENAPNLVAHLEARGAVLELPSGDLEVAVRDGDHHVVLVIPPEFGAELRAGRPASLELVIDSSRNEARTSVRRTRRLLGEYSRKTAALRLLARGVHPDVSRPLAIEEIDLSTPQKAAANVLNMIPMFVLLAAFIGGMYVATDTTAGERERGSFEPLLINPVPRRALAAGKWLATVVFSAVSVVLTLFCSVLALGFVPLEDLGITMTLGAAQSIGLLAATLPLAFLAAGIQLVIATFARSFREAQTYLSLLMFVPMLPAVFFSVSPIKSALWMMPVPVLGQQVLLMDVIRGESVDAVGFVLAAVSSLALAAVFLEVTARLFRRERIIFG